MNFDPLSFSIGKHGDSGPVRNVVSYLMGRAVAAAGEIWQTITNVAVASFTAVSTTLRNLVIDVTPVQSGSGDPSPTNVRLISGWTGSKIVRTGKNLLDAVAVVEGAIDENGDVVPSTTTKISPLIRVKSNTDYVLSGISGTNVRWKYFRSDGSFIGQSETLGLTMTTPADCVSLRLQAANDTWGVVANWQFEEGATPTSYEAFGTTYVVSWQSEAGTVYGGILVDNGDGTWTMTETYIGARVKDFGWTRAQVSGASFYRFWVYFDEKSVGLDNIICEALQRSDADTLANMADNSIRSAVTSNAVSIRADAFSTVEELTDTTTGIGNAVIVYELATPQTYILTAESVRATIGQNNIFADVGNINTITFRTN